MTIRIHYRIQRPRRGGSLAKRLIRRGAYLPSYSSNAKMCLPVVLHADHDPALLQCRVVECLGKDADLGGVVPAPVPRGAHVEVLAFPNPKKLITLIRWRN
jgi:hypothetical protein